MRSCLVLGSLLVAASSLAGCFAPEEDDADRSEADLTSTSEFGAGCSAPVRSDDGAYVVLDLCPADGAAGRVVRLDIASGEKQEVATYPATDRLERLSAKGSRFFFGVRHEVDRAGRATAGIDVSVHDWSLTQSRTIPTAPPSGAPGGFRTLETLMLSADGSHIAFSASDGALASYLFVAPVTGDVAPIGVDLGIPSDELRWSASGASFVGHQADPTPWTGETLVLVDVGGAETATIVGKRHVSFNSFEFGQGGARRQSPFDGARVVGFKKNADGSFSVGTSDPRTGEEKVLDTAPVLSIVSDLGSDILYTRVTDVAEGGVKRELVKMPRAGGEPTILVEKTTETLDELAYGFDPLALEAGGSVGVFQTREGTATVLLLVKLDGSGAEEMSALRVGEQVGSKLLLEYMPSGEGAAPSFDVLDLQTGERTSAGASSRKPAVMAGDGSVFQLEPCRMEDGSSGISVTRPASGGAPGACARMPWAVTPLAAPSSGAIVFYSSYGPFPNYRYDVGIVKP